MRLLQGYQERAKSTEGLAMLGRWARYANLSMDFAMQEALELGERILLADSMDHAEKRIGEAVMAVDAMAQERAFREDQVYSDMVAF